MSYKKIDSLSHFGRSTTSQMKWKNFNNEQKTWREKNGVYLCLISNFLFYFKPSLNDLQSNEWSNVCENDVSYHISLWHLFRPGCKQFGQCLEKTKAFLEWAIYRSMMRKNDTKYIPSFVYVFRKLSNSTFILIDIFMNSSSNKTFML